MISCKIKIEEGSKCKRCCESCKDRCQEKCVFLKTNLECSNKIKED